MSVKGNQRTVDVRELKSWVRSVLPKDHPLRASLEVEDDAVSTEEFMAKVTLWLRLSRLSS